MLLNHASQPIQTWAEGDAISQKILYNLLSKKGYEEKALDWLEKSKDTGMHTAVLA